MTARRRAPDETLGLALLRVALLPIALVTESAYSDVSSDVFPWMIAAFGVYAIVTLVLAVSRTAASRISPLLALVDLGAVAALVYATGGEQSPLKFAFYVLPIGAALRLSPRLTAGWTGLSVLAFLAVTVPHPDTTLPQDLDILVDDTLALLWVGGAAVMLSAMVGRRQRALVEFADARRELVQQALDAEAREQRRLAEALHDHAIQNVLLARQELTDVVRGVPGAEARARAALDETDRQLRHEVFAMHPLGLERAGLATVLEGLAQNAAHHGGFTATVNVDAAVATGDHQDLIVSTARELLANAAKHSRAAHVDVTLGAAAGTVTLTVADDGRGLAPERLERAVSGGHIGLAALTERVRAVDGSIDVDSVPGSGTTVRVTLPAGQES